MMYKSSPFSTFSPAIVFYIVDNSHPNECEVISHCVFYLLMISDAKYLSMYLLAIFMFSLINVYSAPFFHI